MAVLSESLVTAATLADLSAVSASKPIAFVLDELAFYSNVAGVWTKVSGGGSGFNTSYIDWQQKVNVLEFGGSWLEKFGGVNGVWDAGAYSAQQAETGKFISAELTVFDTLGNSAIGIVNKANAIANIDFANLTFGALLFSDSNIYSIIGGIATIIQAYTTNDIISVLYSPKADAYILKNGKVIFSQGIGLVYPLVAVSRFERIGATIKECKITIET